MTNACESLADPVDPARREATVLKESDRDIEHFLPDALKRLSSGPLMTSKQEFRAQTSVLGYVRDAHISRADPKVGHHLQYGM